MNIRTPVPGALAAVILALGLMTGCAVSAGDGIPDAGQPESGDTSAPTQDAQAYAECMREHGVEMSDPDPGTGLPELDDSVDPQSPRYQAAQDACGDLLPAGIRGDDEQDFAVYLEFAECMRENGLPEFPDPQPGAEGMFPDAGVDRNSPEFQAAAEACGDILAGAGQ